jgi:hypothetical protein
MLVAQLLPFVKNLAARKWSDEDVPEDVQFLRDELKARFDSLTTYDEYTSELSSGHLSWSPVHTSDAFWKENAQKLNEGNYEQLKSVPSPNFVLCSWYHPGILICFECVGSWLHFSNRVRTRPCSQWRRMTSGSTSSTTISGRSEFSSLAPWSLLGHCNSSAAVLTDRYPISAGRPESWSL